jgi:D-alanyl-D-alanine carboxypeptidase/Putative peptidoglycan binding domain/Predicted Peptidoglycan domain
MSTPEMRRRMAAEIVNYEARRDAKGHLKVYNLPKRDGGGRYEVAGINERYNKETADALVGLIGQKKFAEAEALAVDFIAQDTDRVSSWSKIPSVEFYLRDCCFNRGLGGAARILQRALGVKDDGAVGDATRAALSEAEKNPGGLLAALRAAREQYERDVVGYREEFWKGLVNRWDKALKTAKSFPSTSQIGAMSATMSTALAGPQPSPLPIARTADTQQTPVVAALGLGSKGDRVAAWQSFLTGRKFDTGPIDGSFDEHTREATRAFQKKHDLTADGIAGEETLLRANKLGLPLFDSPAEDKASTNYPPRPSFPPISTNEQRQAVFGAFDYVSAPEPKNPEAIRILGTWERDNIVSVPVPQLGKALGKNRRTMQFHRLGASQLQGLWAEWDTAGLLGNILTYDGSFNARFVIGSRTVLSNHAFGSAFDINEPYNKLGHRPALVGEKGCVRELVGIANKWGFFWGGHYSSRLDGMHFEIAFLK